MTCVSFYTFGCKLNQLETEALADAFRQNGFCVTAYSEEKQNDRITPDIFIVNTCTVTSQADQKARRLIRKLLVEYPASNVIVTGCYASLDAEKIKELEGKEGAGRLKVISDKSALMKLPKADTKSGCFTPRTFSFHTRAFMKIQDGCNNHCTYCRARLARGPSISVSAEKLLHELQALENSGYWEAVLTGVNICQYQDTVKGMDNLGALLEYLLSGTQKIGLRLSSLEPEKINEGFAKTLAHPRVRPHFHLSIQSGSRGILQKMGRSYSADTVEKAAALLRLAKHNPFLACDIIAGFPGETDDDFNQTLSLCKNIGFAWIHAFPFSRRPGTEAFSFPGRVPEAEIKRRVEALTQLAGQGRAGYVQAHIGMELEALVEKGREKTAGYCRGLSDNYIRLLIQHGMDVPPVPGTVLRCRVVSPLDQAANSDRYDALAHVVL